MDSFTKIVGTLSAVLGVAGAWCIGYSVIDKFDAREYGDVGFGGVVKRTPEYDAWAKKNDTRTYWGLWIVTLSGVLQIVCLCVPSSPRQDTGKGTTSSEDRPELREDTPVKPGETVSKDDHKSPSATPSKAFPQPGTKTQQERAKQGIPPPTTQPAQPPKPG